MNNRLAEVLFSLFDMPQFLVILYLSLLSLFGLGAVQAGQIDLNGPPGSGRFGVIVTMLPNGNFIITDPDYDAPGPVADVGVVYLYDGVTLNVISVLTGSTANDQVGIAGGSNGIKVLSNGNFVVCSSHWNGNRGAVTWGSATSGIPGTVSASNSLVGNTPDDQVGDSGSITELANGNYVVWMPNWDNGAAVNAGAVTWGSGNTGVSGPVSSSNSLVGSRSNDLVGNDVIKGLSNGNYVVRMPNWDNGANVDAGAVTWGSGTSGVSGPVSSSNSLVGTTAGDQVGAGNITPIPNGNYVVTSQFWSGSRGAVTWGSGTGGISGEVSSSNSLTGTTPSDSVGITGITVLSNGNYVVKSANWSNGMKVNAGAATWGNGSVGISGEISGSNSLVGSTADDMVGRGIIGLTNGNYVVLSQDWDNGPATNVGAATWGSGTSGVVGMVSPLNSLVGSNAGDRIGTAGFAVLDGNYVVRGFNWNGNRGALTWGSGTSGITGAVSASNSLVGSTPGDFVGAGISVLSNGNYVVRSSNWNGNRGAVTWGSGTNGISGAVSASNSLVGQSADDQVGSSGVAVLSNGNYVVLSPLWRLGAAANVGAATWGSGTTGISGAVSASNSLVGSTANDRVGDRVVTYWLPNGNYVIGSQDWNGKRGAVTWGSGTGGVSGVVSAANSLVGSTANDRVGSSSISALPNGNYLVRSSVWNGNRGAVTWGSGTSGVSGTVSPSNSLVGSIANDGIGGGGSFIQADGNYVVLSRNWRNGEKAYAGAVTLGEGAAGITGPVTAANSVLGMLANGGHSMTFEYDVARKRIVVGYPAANQVSVFDFSPEISVTGNASVISAGDTIPSSSDHTDFGGALAGGGSVVRSFTVSNSGMETLNLTGLPLVAVSGTNAADFTVTLQPGAEVGSAASAIFQVTFMPGGTGLRTATLRVANNDSNESPFEFAIQGTGQTALENWRSTYFGNSTENVGNLEDFDADGVNNLFEFAFGTLPDSKVSGAASLRYAGSVSGEGIITATGQPITQFAGNPDGRDFRALFVRRKNYLAAGLTYTPRFSADLSAWHNSTGQPIVLADDGIHQIVSVPYPSFITEEEAGFFKISVTLDNLE